MSKRERQGTIKGLQMSFLNIMYVNSLRIRKAYSYDKKAMP